MKIGIIGDLHIAPKPGNRIDDYFQNGLNKIEEIAKNCDVAIFLGDIFSTPKVDEQYTNRLIRHLRQVSVIHKCQFHTIVGNHDVSNELEENLLDNSSLGTLYSAGVINVILPEKPLVVETENKKYRFNTIPVNYKKAKEYSVLGKYGQQEYEDILLIHHEYETGTNCFSYNDLKDTKCKWIFFGHDHKPMDQGRVIYPEFTAYRSGSIMRNRADDYNFTRTLYYYVIENDNVACQAINTIPANDVFKIEAISKENYNKQKFIESIDIVIEKYKKNISKQDRFSIKNILEEMKIPTRAMQGIEKKHQKFGERFE